MDKQGKKTLVVVIPAYNESATIGEVVKRIPRGCMDLVKVLVVDDGSSDDTSGHARAAGADFIERLPTNRGLGVAFKKGIDRALSLGADYVVNIDADMQFDPKDMPALLDPILRQEADFVVCSRFMDKSLEPTMPWIKKVGNKVFSRLISALTGVHLTDTQCGFRAYSREAAMRLNVMSTFTYTQESLIDLIEKGMRVKEVPCRVRGEREGKSRVVSSVLSYTLRSLTIIIRTIRDYRPLEFFGTIGATTFMLGVIAGSFMFLRWVLTSRTSGYQNLINASILLIIFGFLLIIMALQADMQTRQRRVLEEMLYLNKKRL
jgi:glycosyltransferase involved in cell wall biosynthesis